MGVVLAAMLQVSEVTGDTTFQDYTFKNFDFIFTHLPGFGFERLIYTHGDIAGLARDRDEQLRDFFFRQ